MEEREHLERAMAAMEAQRGVLGDAVVDAALAAFREKLSRQDQVKPNRRKTAPDAAARDIASADAARPAQRPAALLAAEVGSLTGDSGTGLSEVQPEVTGWLWLRLDMIITRWGGRIDHRVGSRVFVLFSVQEDCCERAVRAALEMLDETRRFCDSLVLRGLDFRAGLVLGPLEVNAETREMGLSAATLQQAVKLLEAAAPGKVLITAGLFALVHRAFDLLADGALPAGSAGEALPIYQVRGARLRVLRSGQDGSTFSGLAAASGLPGGTGALVGREAELARLQMALDEALQTSSIRVVTLVGEAGMGKSRLVREFLLRLDRSGLPFILFRGRGDPQMNRFPYALLRDLLAFRFKIHEGDSPLMAREKLLRGVEAWLGADGVETAHWIGHLAGCDFANSPYLSGRLDDPRRARQKSFQALNGLFSVIAAHTPLLILVDDLQWADDGSLDWLDSLALSKPAGPVLLVHMARPALLERRPSWGAGLPGSLRLDLDPLANETIAKLAEQLLHAALSSRHMAEAAGGSVETLLKVPIQQVVERADGNPFYAEELVMSILESGVFLPALDVDNQPVWQVDPSRLAADRLPSSLVEVLRTRLESLPGAERAVLERAAVVGPVFWEAAVRVLFESTVSGTGPLNKPQSSNAEADLLRSVNLPVVLRSLQARGLIFRREIAAFEHTEEFVFKNALLYEVAYENISARQRRENHATVAAWLAAQSGERVETYSATIAGHYERAAEQLLAADWYGLAALQARRSSAPEAAVRYLTRALELLPDEPAIFAQRVQLYKSLWDVLWWQARYAEALAIAQALLVQAEARRDLPSQSAAWNRIAAVQNRQNEYTSALRSVQRAERLARTGGASREVALALFNRGVTLYHLGDAAAAKEAGEEALAYHQTLGDEETQLPTPHRALPRRPDSRFDVLKKKLSHEAAGEAAHAGADPGVAENAREAVNILNLLALINQRAGRYAEAESDYRQALERCRKLGDRPALIATLIHLGANAYLRGDHQAAVAHYQEALALMRQLGFHDLELICLNHLAAAQVELGQFAQAETHLHEVLARQEDDENRTFLTEVYRSLALSYLGQGQFAESVSAGQRALTLAREQGLSEAIGQAWRVLGRICARTSQPVAVDQRQRSAHDCYAASLQIFVELSAAGEQARTTREWASYELAHGERQEGIRLWQEARDLFARLGFKAELERMDQLAASREENSNGASIG